MQADKKTADKAAKLKQKLIDADYRYYILNKPDIDDYTYDMLMKELQEIEANFPELKSLDSHLHSV